MKDKTIIDFSDTIRDFRTSCIEKFRYIKNIENNIKAYSYNNKHKGKRCFIIGNNAA